jgi:hypothetical protein
MSPIRPENRGRSCDWCGQTFHPYRGRRDVRWCSILCKRRAAAAAPRLVPKACAHCGHPFLPAKFRQAAVLRLSVQDGREKRRPASGPETARTPPSHTEGVQPHRGIPGRAAKCEGSETGS